MRGERVDTDRETIELLRQLLRAVEAAIRDYHASQTMRVQVTRGERDRFARTNQQCRVIGEVLEHLARQAHRSRCNRHRVRADACLRADALRDGERRLHQPVQVWAGDALVVRRAIRSLQLSQDLRLAQHQRVQAAGDGENVLDRRRAVQPIEAA